MRINLMPVVPKTQKFKFPIFIMVAALALGISGLVAFDAYGKARIYVQTKEEYQQIVAKKEALEAELLANRQESQTFADYYTLFNKANEGHYDWTIVLDAVAAKLPEDATITQLELIDYDQLSLSVDLPSVAVGSQLIQVLEDADWSDEVTTVTSDFYEDQLILDLVLLVDFEPLLKEGR